VITELMSCISSVAKNSDGFKYSLAEYLTPFSDSVLDT